MAFSLRDILKFNLATRGDLNRVYTGTWAGRPTTGLIAGTTAQFTDLNNILLYTDGTNWLPINGRATIARVGAQVAAAAQYTTETPLLTLPIKGGLARIHGGIELDFQLSYTNSSNSKTVRLRIGTSLPTGTTGLLWNHTLTTTTDSIVRGAGFQNRGSLSSQIQTAVPFSNGGGNGAAPLTTTQDTSADYNLYLTAQTTSPDTVALESYTAYLCG